MNFRKMRVLDFCVRPFTRNRRNRDRFNYDKTKIDRELRMAELYLGILWLDIPGTVYRFKG